ncbi:leucyl aminopeptidase family protein [Ruania halotolerans]|uniref:leucyl aminopeptidase family protein n=1 Tax=Ruania halotolerans TaxID=2897773 RepID=UPI001E58EC40|nr:leucyl aminopeptidase family protein [Ruania halotolerans]UFU05584.1 leucyl aminopeptidase family protein [Ruania halotolerans]
MAHGPTLTAGPAAPGADDLRDWGEQSTLVLALASGHDRPDGAGSVSLRVAAVPAYGIEFAEWAASAGATGAAGEAVVAPLPPVAAWAGLPRRVVFLGVGDGTQRSARRAGAALARATAGCDHAAIVLSTLLDDAAASFVEGVLLGAYSPPSLGSAADRVSPLAALTLCSESEGIATAVAEGAVAAETTLVARRLAATPSNVKNPQWMAGQARELAQDTGLQVQVHDERWLAEHGFGGILAVGGGSDSPARLVTVEHPGSGATNGAPVVLVGKGITYDTGGISLKPREAMIPMKTDMAGAAAVLGAVLGAARAGLAVRVIAVLPLAENAVGAASYRPGDVVEMVDGTTVEIGNTDAEGRMVLADAMAWARTEYAPSALVDVATLTGAASLGLGKRHAALYATDDHLRAGLEAAAERTGEQVWAMPLVQEYRTALDSTVADLCHIATDSSVGGGSITAALFLQQFAGSGAWAHLDIAGPGRAPKPEHEVNEGATGFGARLLFRWLQSLT